MTQNLPWGSAKSGAYAHISLMKRSVGLSEHQRGDADQCLVHVLYLYKYVEPVHCLFACVDIYVGYIAIFGPV